MTNQVVTHPRRRATHAGFTLVELLLAIAITAVIGAAATTLLFGMNTATRNNADLRAMTVRSRVLEARLGTAIRSSTRILSLSTFYVVLWTGDRNGDSMANISELRRIEWSVDGKFTSYVGSFPAGWTEDQVTAADTAYDPATTNFYSVTNTLKTGSYFPGQTWITGVNNCAFKADKQSLPDARLLSYRIQFLAGGLTREIDSASALRQPG